MILFWYTSMISSHIGILTECLRVIYPNEWEGLRIIAKCTVISKIIFVAIIENQTLYVAISIEIETRETTYPLNWYLESLMINTCITVCFHSWYHNTFYRTFCWVDTLLSFWMRLTNEVSSLTYSLAYSHVLFHSERRYFHHIL